MVGGAGEPERGSPAMSAITWRMVVTLVLSVLLLPVTLFACAGRLDWPMAWAFSIIGILVSLGGRGLVAIKHPDLLAERGRFAEARNTKAWDRKLSPLVGLVGPIVVAAVAGLDERFDWSPELSPTVQIGGLVVVLAGYVLATWAMVENRFYSAVVRIQSDRGHQVVSTGPYAFVRHPSYLGGYIYYLATGPALGSLWALVPAAAVLALLAVRTALEDRTLQAELPGYAEYAERVRYRLVPGVW